MNIHAKLYPNLFGLAFSLQDVDRTYEYVMALRRLGVELAELSNLEESPKVEKFEDETGYYIVVNFKSASDSLNYIDLLTEMMKDPELELNLEDLQLLTFDTLAYQRFSNAKEENLRYNLYDVIDKLNETAMPERILAIEQTILYNRLDKAIPILQALVQELYNNGIDVADAVNAVAKPTIH